MGGPIVDTDYSLLAPDDSDVQIEIDGDTATVRNGNITAKLISRDEFIGALNYDIHRCEVQYFNSDGQLLLKELGEGGSLQLRPRHFKAAAGSSYQLTASFEAPEDEKLYGMGQYQQETFNLKGSTLELAHRNSQASVPFVFSSAGYGFLWHNPAIGEATFGMNRTVWTAESTNQLDYWITAGRTPAEIAKAYAGATGHTPTMPDYGLGYWQCKLRYFTQDQLMEVAREHKRRGIPLDVIVADFFHWPKMGDFRFDEEFWPDPQAMIDELKEMGVELMVSVWPQISHESENFSEMTAHNLTVKTLRGMDVQMAFQGPSVFADMTNPNTHKYVWDKCKTNYYDKGVRIFWLDEAEPEYGIYDYDNYRYYQGTDLEIGVFCQL